MAKKSTLGNMIGTLFIITVLSSAILAATFQLTKAAISNNQDGKLNKTISKVLPQFNNNPTSEVIKKYVDGDTVYLYKARMDGKDVGCAVKTFTNNGYGGRIDMLIGFLPNGVIHKVEVLQHSETPGIGDKIEGNFSTSFSGKNPKDYKLTIKKDGGDIDGITGVTVSSKAFLNALNRGYNVFAQEILKDEKIDSSSGATS